jgi:hypothetical protein
MRIDEKWIHRGLFLMVLLCAVWLRWWQLDAIPPGLWYDEAYNGMDAAWMMDSGSLRMFFVDNNGREPMYPYLVALAISVFGAGAFALRWVSAIAGIIAIPLMYRWSKTLFHNQTRRNWLALFAAAGLAFSFWHLVMSRNGFRTVLLPAFVIATGYFFWLGLERRQLRFFVLAGGLLGLSQYTYLSARLLPLWLGLFVVLVTIMHFVLRQQPPWIPLRMLWLGSLVTASVSLLVFAPLGYYFLNNTDLFIKRTGQVTFWAAIAEGDLTLIEHFRAAVSVFAGGYDGNWRHDLPGHATFGWLIIIGFWVGLLITMWRTRRPLYLYILTGGIVMWLPGLLSVPAVHALRLSGLLPFYYLISAVGFNAMASFVGRRYLSAKVVSYALIGLILLFSGGRTGYNYFHIWANDINVYFEYEGHLADLTEHLLSQFEDQDILMPYTLYEHPAVRFLLHDRFQETSQPPMPAVARPGLIVAPSELLARRSNSDSYVWLTRDQTGSEMAYIPLQSWNYVDIPLANSPPIPFTVPVTSTTLATLTPIESTAPLASLFATWPDFIPLNFDWQGKLKLMGYQVVPEDVLPGYSLDVRLFWQLLQIDTDWNYDVVVEVRDVQGQPVSTSTFSMRELFNWRQAGTAVSAQYLFFISPELPAGPYIIYFHIERPDGEIIPVEVNGQPVAEATLGLFYIRTEEADPRQPPAPMQASFGDNNLTLTGYAPPLPLGNNVYRGKIYWRAQSGIEGDFSPVVDLLDSDGNIISHWNAPPLGGQYPTSMWKAGEVIVYEFDMVLPADIGAGSYRLVTGLLEPVSGATLPVFDEAGVPQPDNFWLLEQINLE